METNTETNETPDRKPTETPTVEVPTETTETTGPAETSAAGAPAVPDAPAKRRGRPRAATVRGMVAGDVLDPRNTLW